MSQSAKEPRRWAFGAALAAALSAATTQLGLVYATFARVDPLVLIESGTTPLQVTQLMAGPCVVLGVASGLVLLPVRRLRWYWGIPAGVAISFLLAWLLQVAGLRLAATI